MARGRARLALAFAALLATGGAGASAQSGSRGPRIEGRGEALIARRTSTLFAVGAAVRVGTYARVAAWAGGGPSLGEPDRVVGRVEGGVRFLLDPFRERRIGPYAMAGIGIRGVDRWRERGGYLVLLVGAEGARRKGWAPSVELGLGDGARIALVVRRAETRYR